MSKGGTNSVAPGKRHLGSPAVAPRPLHSCPFAQHCAERCSYSAQRCSEPTPIRTRRPISIPGLTISTLGGCGCSWHPRPLPLPLPALGTRQSLGTEPCMLATGSGCDRASREHSRWGLFWELQEEAPCFDAPRRTFGELAVFRLCALFKCCEHDTVIGVPTLPSQGPCLPPCHLSACQAAPAAGDKLEALRSLFLLN